MSTIRIQNITFIISTLIEIKKIINKNLFFKENFNYSVLTKEELQELENIIILNKQRLLKYIKNPHLLFDI